MSEKRGVILLTQFLGHPVETGMLWSVFTPMTSVGEVQGLLGQKEVFYSQANFSVAREYLDFKWWR